MESRLPTLFLQICQQNKTYEIEDIAKQFSVSTRTVYNDIKKINELLVTEKYEEIKIEKGIVSYKNSIPFTFEKLINYDDNYVLNHPQIRRLRLLKEVLLFNSQFTVDDLIVKLPLSRNTLFSDLKWVKEELNFYQIQLLSRPFIGYQIVGSEKDIRNLLIITILEDPLGLDGSEEIKLLLKQSEELIDLFTEKLGIVLSDSSYDRLRITFFVTIKRILAGKELDMLKKNTKEEIVLFQLKEKIEEIIHIAFSDNELIYLAQKISESSLINYNDQITEKWIDYYLIGDNFIKEVAKISNNNYFTEDELLYQGVINHLRPAYMRVMSHSEISNPMHDYVNESFRMLHENVVEGIKLIEQHLNIRFSDHEVSFFTLFFIASLERKRRYPTKPKKIVIVCDAGVSTSQILRSKLESNFDVIIQGVFGKRTINEWLSKNETDLIISTIPFKHPILPSLHVEPFVTEEDMKKLYILLRVKKRRINLNEVFEIIDQTVKLTNEQEKEIKINLDNYFNLKQFKIKKEGVYQPMLMEVLNEGLIKVNFKAKTRTDAVRVSGQLLVDNGLAKDSYIDAMVENVKVNGNYIVIAPGIAMPHARPETGALNIGLSIVTLKDPVTFGHPQNDPVKLVIGLCAIDHQSHLKALSELVEILSDEKKVKQIEEAKDTKEIMKIIKGGN